MEAKMYKIRAITHMQPGSGETNMGVIDNMIQRDPATGWPVIHASSLKGALKEFFKNKNNITTEKECSDDNKLIKFVFGCSENDKSHPGNYRFLPAMLLAIPQRATKKPYYMTTSPGVIKQFLDLVELLNYDLDEEIKNDLEEILKPENLNFPAAFDNNELVVEDFENINSLEIELSENTKKFLGVENNNLLLVTDEDFNKIVHDNNLPVIARNQLENGESQNLWYEQVLPRESIFVVPIMIPEKENFFNEFNKDLTGNLIQIGGNATVGYGYTRFINLENLKTQKS